jgi:hypothetical protein
MQQASIHLYDSREHGDSYIWFKLPEKEEINCDNEDFTAEQKEECKKKMDCDNEELTADQKEECKQKGQGSDGEKPDGDKPP